MSLNIRPSETPRQILERHVLASVLAQPTFYDEARALRAIDFSDPDYQNIWDRIQSVAGTGRAPTPKGVAAASFDLNEEDLVRLSASVAPNVDSLRRAVTSLISEVRRAEVIVSMNRALNLIRNDGAADWETTVAALTLELSDRAMTRASLTGAEARHALLTRMAQNQKRGKVPTGLSALDNALRGGLSTGLIMLGAFGKQGKTTMVATLSYNLELQEIPHAVFTLERQPTDIEALKAAREAHINALELSDHLALPPSNLPQRTVHYIHQTRMTADQIRNDILFHVRRHRIRAAFVDYWQLIEPGPGAQGARKAQQMERIAQELQRTSMDADIPLFVTYQIGDSPQNPDIAAARTAANLCLHLQREASECWLRTIATNVSDEKDIGGVTAPVITFDRDAGPHFRDPNPIPF